ncbi:dehydrogenase [Sphingomonas oleivorans]|uniref:Dehydrogenase n=1 Tax=Sphingomonas oleivorans TaxID=1735121 RepID=A0A2T5FTV7_9SPHN|nr:NAD(P)-dependent oxidoreductase [Sphingomonas oleivorans]PTQ07507.1 dehydrogenase [Sphingomonas oleivorans]
MSLVIASQMEEGFNADLRAHRVKPIVIDVPEERPWEAANDADMLLVRPSPAWRGSRDRARPAAWPGRLKWVYSASAGVDFYPRWLLDAPIVSCGRGVASDEIADYVIAAIYAQAKNLEAVRARSLSDWKQAPLGRVSGSTVGIIGLGAIGTAVARRVLALGARVVASRRRHLPSPVAGVELLDDLGLLVASADHLVLALPATEATRKLIDAKLLARARPTAHLINVARGSVLDQDALLAALDAGRLGFATLDVTEPEPLPAGHPLWTHPLVRLTPHVSSNYTAVRGLLFDRVAANIDRFVRGEAPGDIVDVQAGY